MLSFPAEKAYFGVCLMAEKMERLPDLRSLIEEMKSRNFNMTKSKL